MNRNGQTYSGQTSGETGFVIDKVGEETWTWALLDQNGNVLARAAKGYDSCQEAQVAIASTRIHARNSDVPTQESDLLIG